MHCMQNNSAYSVEQWMSDIFRSSTLLFRYLYSVEAIANKDDKIISNLYHDKSTLFITIAN